ncbi:MAG: rod shape-determining protein RodA, partial [Actinomycetota bacterium]|nr:rod shape-determining protein RodA [Actinomycetota bacterium]
SLLVWSATRERLLQAGGAPQAYLRRHVLNALLGAGLGAVAASVDYRAVRAWAPVIHVVSTLGLVAVLLLGTTINGAHSWIVLPGGLQVQPSEFAKVALVVLCAMLLADRRVGEERPRDSEVLLVLVVAAVPMALVMLQPDLGTMLVLCATLLGVLVVAGARLYWVVGLVAAGIVTAAAAVALGVLDDYQIARFAAFANPELDPRGVGYNTNQARIAIGSGGLLGKGLFQGTQTTGRFVPEQQTDFVFTVAGEELGFLGAAAVILLLGVVLWRGLRAASRAGDDFGRIVAGGVVCWLGFQAFINVGMTLGITPVTGLPLPFVSYGGSAMFANLLAVGLLVNVGLRAPRRVASAEVLCRGGRGRRS